MKVLLTLLILTTVYAASYYDCYITYQTNGPLNVRKNKNKYKKELSKWQSHYGPNDHPPKGEQNLCLKWFNNKNKKDYIVLMKKCRYEGPKLIFEGGLYRCLVWKGDGSKDPEGVINGPNALYKQVTDDDRPF